MSSRILQIFESVWVFLTFLLKSLLTLELRYSDYLATVADIHKKKRAGICSLQPATAVTNTIIFLQSNTTWNSHLSQQRKEEKNSELLVFQAFATYGLVLGACYV